MAEATPPGRGGLRVVRVSGPLAAPILQRHFRPAGPRSPWEAPRRLCAGDVLSADGRLLDRALAVFLRAPRSFTGEDTAEFHLHGSGGVVEAVVALCLEAGCRRAAPGEFSWRAFLNGKLGLLEAEALDGLAAASTREAAQRAAAVLAGDLRRKLEGLREGILDLQARWEAQVDFPEDAGEGAPEEERALLGRLVAEADALDRSGQALPRLREGWSVALAGPPNSGKSSLFNALLNRERALVSPHPGTTRDVLEETLEVDGLPLVLRDTAGLRQEPGEEVEALGMEVGLRAAATADAVLFVYDGARGWDGEAQRALRILPAPPRWIAGNKGDLFVGPVPPGHLRLSARTGEGLAALVREMGRWLRGQLPRVEAGPVSLRQAEAVGRLRRALGEAEGDLAGGAGIEVAADALARARRAVEEALFGEGRPDDLYGRIFSRFCIGK
ncbi:MAG: tRNA modification GTPase [Acidobacteriota bacterium]